MSELCTITTAVPACAVSAAATKAYLSSVLRPAAAARLARIVDGSGIETRYGVRPLDELARLQSIEERNRVYAQHALQLAETVAASALAAAEVHPNSVAAIVAASSTGHLMPSLDAHLIARLRLRPDVRRLPMTQLGCSGALAGVGLGRELLPRGEESAVLIVALDLPSVWFHAFEPSPNDVVAAALLGDGAAAALITQTRGLGPEIVASRSVLWPDTLHSRGSELTSSGLRHVFSPGFGRVVEANLRRTVDAFLGDQGLGISDLRFFALQPAGPTMLDTMATSLGVSSAALRAPRTVWTRHGNLLGPGTLFVLRELAEGTPPEDGDLGLALALGSGVSCEMVLLRWHAGLACRN